MNFELQKGADLKQDVVTWINFIMNSLHVAEEAIERIHFVGNPRNKRPRPIILKILNYVKKRENSQGH